MGKNKLLVTLVLFFGLAGSSFAQDRYAVFYKYKPQIELSLNEPTAFLTSKALARRARENVKADSLDLPVSKIYIDQVLTLSNYVLYSSKWLNATITITDATRASEIAKLPFVSNIELVGRGFLPNQNTGIDAKLSAAATQKLRIPSSENERILASQANTYDFQNELIGITQMLAEGYSGKGITIAVFDAGFPGANTSAALKQLETNKQLIATKDFVRPWNSNVFQDNQHGMNVLSLIASKDPAILIAGAPDANYILAMTEEIATEYRVEEYNWVRAAEFSDSLGVDIIASSVGYWDFDDLAMNYTVADLDGKTTTITKGATIAAGKGILVVNSAGNYGSSASTLVAPADAEGILAIGSVNKDFTVSSFSSRGPTGDGRIKPDLVTFGNGVFVIRSNGVVGTVNGTSFSAPQVTALAAGIWQARPEWTKDKLIEMLLASGTNAEKPDNQIGHGIPRFREALYGEILSAEESLEIIQWKIFPNPLDGDELTIYFGTDIASEFTLLDMNGRVLDRKNLSRSSTRVPYQVSVVGLKPGLYLIQLQDGQLIKRSKLMKQ
jgi:subtilisin family serine protease